MADDADAPHERRVSYHEGTSLRDALKLIADRELPWTTASAWQATSGPQTLGWLRQTSPDARGYTIIRVADEAAAFTSTSLHFVYER